jgi:hypothetical protein
MLGAKSARFWDVAKKRANRGIEHGPERLQSKLSAVTSQTMSQTTIRNPTGDLQPIELIGGPEGIRTPDPLGCKPATQFYKILPEPALDQGNQQVTDNRSFQFLARLAQCLVQVAAIFSN